MKIWDSVYICFTIAQFYFVSEKQTLWNFQDWRVSINLLQFSHICASFCLHLEGGTIQQPFKIFLQLTLFCFLGFRLEEWLELKKQRAVGQRSLERRRRQSKQHQRLCKVTVKSGFLLKRPVWLAVWFDQPVWRSKRIWASKLICLALMLVLFWCIQWGNRFQTSPVLSDCRFKCIQWFRFVTSSEVKRSKGQTNHRHSKSRHFT